MTIRPLQASDIIWYRGANDRDFKSIGRIENGVAYLRQFPGVAIGRIKKKHLHRVKK